MSKTKLDCAIDDARAKCTVLDHVWHWRSRLPERKGQRCRVLVRGGKNNVLVEFEDGYRVVTSRYAVRLAQAGDGGARDG